MYSKVIQYQGLDNDKREGIYWFNLAISEAMVLQTTYEDGPFMETMEKVIKLGDQAGIIKMFTTVIEVSYGQRHPDGEQFVKSHEIYMAFKQTDAYEQLFLWLVEIDNFVEFMNSVIKPEYVEQMKAVSARTEARLSEISNQPRIISNVPREELLAMSDEDFLALAGPDRKKWNKRTLTIASQRKNRVATEHTTIVS